jgi:hypothetical protein
MYRFGERQFVDRLTTPAAQPSVATQSTSAVDTTPVEQDALANESQPIFPAGGRNRRRPSSTGGVNGGGPPATWLTAAAAAGPRNSELRMSRSATNIVQR